MLDQIINTSNDKLKELDLPPNAVYDHVISQFVFKMMDNIALFISADSQSKKSAVYLHNAKKIEKDELAKQISLETSDILI